jgi:hypothetical protein
MTQKRKRRTPAEMAAAKQITQIQGLGDTIDKITTATGIKALVKFIAGEDCGCEERKEKLNKLFSYRKVLCLTENEYNYLNNFFKTNGDSIKPTQQKELYTIHDRVFQIKRPEMSGCADCVRQMVSNLKRVYENYNS